MFQDRQTNPMRVDLRQPQRPHHRERLSESDPVRWEPFPEVDPQASGLPGERRGGRLGAWFLFFLAGVVAWIFREEIRAFLSTIRLIARGNLEDRVVGLCAYGVTLVALLGFIKVLQGPR